MEALILAGGKGERLRPEVSEVPKPLAPVAGRPFLEILLERWIGQGIERFVLSIGYQGEKILARIGSRFRGVPVDYVFEERPLGTGGALALALSELGGERFVCLNGDTFCEVPLAGLVEAHERASAEMTIASRLVPALGSARFGALEVAGSGRVTRMGGGGSGPVAHPSRAVQQVRINAGAYLIERSLVEGVAPPEPGELVSLERELIPGWLRQGRCLASLDASRERFIDIGVPEDYLRAAEYLCPR